MREPDELVLPGNPGAAKHKWRNDGDWVPGDGDLTLRHYHFAEASRTEAEIEICVDTLEGDNLMVSLEFIYEDLVALRDKVDEILALADNEERKPHDFTDDEA